MEPSNVVRTVVACDVCGLCDTMDSVVKEMSENMYLCTSIRFKSDEENNNKRSVAIMEFTKQTCIWFEQRVKYADAGDMSRLNDEIKKIIDKMYLKRGFYCTSLQCQSNFNAHISRSTAIMLFTRQYP